MSGRAHPVGGRFVLVALLLGSALLPLRGQAADEPAEQCSALSVHRYRKMSAGCTRSSSATARGRGMIEWPEDLSVWECAR